MKILILATMAPLLGFYIYALVNFQRELRRGKQENVAGAKTIPLYWHDGQLTAVEQSNEAASVTVSATSDFGLVPDGKRQTVPRIVHESGLEIYQLESTYLGPFLLVPVPRKNGQASQEDVRQSTARRSG
jgi:hypothetical protein